MKRLAAVLMLAGCTPQTPAYRIQYAVESAQCHPDAGDIDVAFAAAADVLGVHPKPLAADEHWFVHFVTPPIHYGEGLYHGLSWGGAISVECPPDVLQGALPHEFLHGMLEMLNYDGDAEHTLPYWQEL